MILNNLNKLLSVLPTNLRYYLIKNLVFFNEMILINCDISAIPNDDTKYPTIYVPSNTRCLWIGNFLGTRDMPGRIVPTAYTKSIENTSTENSVKR